MFLQRLSVRPTRPVKLLLFFARQVTPFASPPLGALGSTRLRRLHSSCTRTALPLRGAETDLPGPARRVRITTLPHKKAAHSSRVSLGFRQKLCQVLRDVSSPACRLEMILSTSLVRKGAYGARAIFSDVVNYHQKSLLRASESEAIFLRLPHFIERL